MAAKNKKQKSVLEELLSSVQTTNSNNAGSGNTSKTEFTLALNTKDGKLVLNIQTESSKQQHASQHQTKQKTAVPKSSPQTSHSNLNTTQKNQKSLPSTSKANTNANNAQKISSNASKTHPNTGQNNSQHHSNTNSVQKKHKQPPKANPNLNTDQKHPPPSHGTHPNHHIQKKSFKNTFKPQPKFNTGSQLSPHAFKTLSNLPTGHRDCYPDFTTRSNWPIGNQNPSATSSIQENLKNIVLASLPPKFHRSREHRAQYDGDRNQIKENVSQGQEQRPRSTYEHELNCPTCKAAYLPQIYQCASGHSSCSSCKEKGWSCGKCGQVITDMRNFSLEEYLTKKKVPCPHEGCKLLIKMLKVDVHIKECPFGILTCPAGCSNKMALKQLSGHFDDRHPGQRLEVGSEVDLRYIYEPSKKMYLIQIGAFHFLFHEWVSPGDRRIYLAAQLIGTKISASQWLYEIHIYNKNEPHRMYTFSEICTSFVQPVIDVIKECKCCILTRDRAVTFLKNAAVNYKVFIRKSEENKPQIDLGE